MKPSKLILPYLDATNIDLKSFSEKTYQTYCGARLKPILENLIQIKKANVHLEVTTLVIPGVNDSEKEFTQIAQFIAQKLGQDTPWHISRFFPAFLMEDTPITPKETLQKAAAIGKRYQLKYVYLGNI
jgi:Pyruvate-formate lyase-activating enzyme